MRYGSGSGLPRVQSSGVMSVAGSGSWAAAVPRPRQWPRTRCHYSKWLVALQDDARPGERPDPGSIESLAFVQPARLRPQGPGAERAQRRRRWTCGRTGCVPRRQGQDREVRPTIQRRGRPMPSSRSGCHQGQTGSPARPHRLYVAAPTAPRTRWPRGVRLAGGQGSIRSWSGQVSRHTGRHRPDRKHSRRVSRSSSQARPGG